MLFNRKIYLLKINTSNSAHIDKLNPSPKPFNINFPPPFIFNSCMDLKMMSRNLFLFAYWEILCDFVIPIEPPNFIVSCENNRIFLVLTLSLRRKTRLELIKLSLSVCGIELAYASETGERKRGK